MKYWLWLRNPDPDGDFCIMFCGEVPATVRPELLAHTLSDFVHDRLKLCGAAGGTCPGTHCHVISETGIKYCPILFSDLVKPGWTADDLDSNYEGGSDSPWAREQRQGRRGDPRFKRSGAGCRGRRGDRGISKCQRRRGS